MMELWKAARFSDPNTPSKALNDIGKHITSEGGEGILQHKKMNPETRNKDPLPLDVDLYRQKIDPPPQYIDRVSRKSNNPIKGCKVSNPTSGGLYR
jgi:hypothetical protein